MIGLARHFVAALIKSGNTQALLQHGGVDHLFKDHEIALFKFVKDHAKKYGQLPHPSTILAHLQEELPDTNEPPEYYRELLEQRYIEHAIKAAAKSAIAILEPGVKNVDKAFEIVRAMVTDGLLRKSSSMLLPISQGYDMVFQQYVSQQTKDLDSGVMFGWPTLDNASAGLAKGDVASFVGRPAAGKASSVMEPVLMADGTWKLMKHVSIGDKLASVDGAPSIVTGVYPQGMRKVFRVTFSDGRSTDVDGDHLWQTYSSRWAERNQVITTTELKARLAVPRNSGRISVPLISGAFGGSSVPVDPYVLGVLLGDGCLTREVSFTSMDEELVQRVTSRLVGVATVTKAASKSSGKASTYYVCGSGRGRKHVLKEALKLLGLVGKNSLEKSIPSVYFSASFDDRLSLLQGLMDTDGTAGKNGGTSFSTSSKQLASDVQALVRSLGGLCSLSEKNTTHALHYVLGVRLPDRQSVFSLERKRAVLSEARKNPCCLTVLSVEPVGELECQCISVSHPSKLYVTRDFIVTHNTWFMLHTGMNAWLHQGKRVMFVSMEMQPLPIAQRMMAMQAHFPIGFLKKAGLSTVHLKKMKSIVTEVKTGFAPYWIVDGNLSATVEDIWAIASYLKPDLIIIDGGYLLKHPTERDRFKRVAENADLIKQELAAIAPTSCSWQFAKTGAAKKKKKGEMADLEDIGYTDAIAQVSSIVVGFMQPEGVETINQRVLSLLKGRNGETGSWRANWNFKEMNFSELSPIDVSDLQFI